MRYVARALRWVRHQYLRLRALVQGEDYDPWYDQHTDEHDRPPNIMGPGSQ